MRGIYALLILAAAACSGRAPFEPQLTAVLDETFTLRVGQEATFTGESLRIFFEGVPEDSRCPLQVNCVWEGNAIVRLRVSTTATDAQVVELNTTLEPRSVSAVGYEIALQGLEPQPQADRPVRQHRYRANLQVKKP